MTREEAIEVIKAYRDKLTNSASNQLDGDIKAFEMAIQALEKENIYDDKEHYVTISKALYDKLNIDYEQALSQEPCDDMISRDAALEKMADYVASGYADSAEDFLGYSRIICQLPSVTQKSGKWIWDNKSNVYRCSCCNQFPWRIDTEENDEVFINMERTNAYKYCPDCGAKMVEPQESEDKE